MLLRYPRASGGIDNAATLVSDLGQKIDSEQLADIDEYPQIASFSAFAARRASSTRRRCSR